MPRETQQFDEIDEPQHDRASDEGAIERQSGSGPYRDRHDALVTKRRQLASELEEAKKSAERAPRLARHLAVVDEALHRDTSWIDAMVIDTPCRERWEKMRGTDAKRRCDRCHRDVHDLAMMTRAEIAALFERSGGACVRIRRRPDGRVVTGDCPPPPPRAAWRAAGTLAAGAILGATTAAAVQLATMSTLGGARVPPPAVVASSPRTPAAPIDLRRLRSAEPDHADEEQVEMGGIDAFTQGYVDAAPPPAGPSDDLDRHVRWIAPQAWEIDRSLLDRALAQASTLRSTVRAIPHEAGGRAVGVKLYGIRRNSLLGRLGIQNGDMIVDVNGLPVAQPDTALEVYSRLRTTDALFVRIVRRGEERLHVYRIVP